METKIKYQFPLRLLKSNRNLRNLWVGETVSYFGDNFYDIAIMWFVFSKTGSGMQTGLVLVSSFLPQVVVGPFLGVLADRWNRKRMMQAASAIQALLTGVLTLLMILHSVAMWEIYGITILLSIVQLAYGPARAGIFPDLLDRDELMIGNALFNTSTQIARLVGSTAGGTVIAFTGPSTAIAFNALTFVVSTLFMQWVAYVPSSVPTRREHRASIFRDMQGGWRWLWGKKVLLILIAIGTVSNIALGPTNVLAPMLIRNVMHGNAAALGVFDACIGLGILVGGLVLGSVSAKRVGILFACGIGLQGVAMALVATASSILVAYVGNFVLGLAVVAANLPTSTLFQLLVPGEMRGRVGSISGMLSSVAIPITYGGIGIFGDAFGARWSYGFGALLLGCCMLAGVWVSSLRRLSITNSVTVPESTEVSV